MEKRNIGVYIHIPFCKSKCYYCDFNSYCNKLELVKEYVEAVKKEIESYNLDEKQIDTIYIGGGTPSYIDENYIKQIMENIDISNAKEITIEVNPGTVTKQKLELYKTIGINRLSIGLQSTDNELLKNIGRIHEFEDFLQTYNLAREVGFENINIDLMLGLPNQTLEKLIDTVNKVIELNPEHISIYSLILEEDTEFYRQNIILLDDDLERKMYWEVNKLLKQNGYNHYEISNYSKKGYESIHNTDCWEQKEYIGIGAGAYSFLDNKRYGNIESIEIYIDNFSDTKYTEETLDNIDKIKERILLGLRKIEGINIKVANNKYNTNILEMFKDELEFLKKEGLIDIDNNIRLTDKGLDLANIVWGKFI